MVVAGQVLRRTWYEVHHGGLLLTVLSALSARVRLADILGMVTRGNKLLICYEVFSIGRSGQTKVS
jgi:hypothetical protein